MTTPKAKVNGQPPNWAKVRLWVVMGACIFVSTAWVIHAAFWGSPADGGRGGAVAVALTFAMLFLDRGTAKDLLERTLPPRQAADAFPDADERLKAGLNDLAQKQAELIRSQTTNRNALAALLDWQDVQKWPLAISSVVGTVFWGFGDCFAAWLSAP